MTNGGAVAPPLGGGIHFREGTHPMTGRIRERIASLEQAQPRRRLDDRQAEARRVERVNQFVAKLDGIRERLLGPGGQLPLPLEELSQIEQLALADPAGQAEIISKWRRTRAEKSGGIA